MIKCVGVCGGGYVDDGSNDWNFMAKKFTLQKDSTDFEWNGHNNDDYSTTTILFILIYLDFFHFIL